MCTKHRLSRRNFIKTLTAGTAAGALQLHLVPDTSWIANAAFLDRYLVLIYLGGGCSLNMFPYDSGAYRYAMGGIFPNISDANRYLIGNNDQYLHPSFGNDFYSMYTAGEFLLIRNVKSYGSRSHETDTNAALSALLSMTAGGNGEIGLGARAGCFERDNPIAAISFIGDQTWSDGACNPPQTLSGLQNLGENPFMWNNRQHEWLTRSRDNVINSATVSNSPQEKFVTSGIARLQNTLGQLRSFTNINPAAPGVPFPNSGLGNALANVMRVMLGQRGSAFRTRNFAVSTGGYDTHSGELNSMANLVTTLSQAILAFRAALKYHADSDGQTFWAKTVAYGHSEFGRTRCNGELGQAAGSDPESGTDHGDTQNMWAFGGPIYGGRCAGSPLSDAVMQRQYRNDFEFDSRSVIAQIYEGTLGVPRAIMVPDPIPSGDNLVGIFR